MAFAMFVGSVVLCGFVLSFFSVDTLNDKPDQPDYHVVPYAGDVWGA